MSPTVFREKGYRFYFLSNEETRIHVHVTSGDGEAKFWLKPDIILSFQHGLNKQQVGEVQKLVEEHEDEIVTAWKKYFG